MATLRQWISGARVRTLPAALAPVIVGTALAAPRPLWSNATLALLVALSLQIGVNYANDYSDGIKGTDSERVGPMRLVGSGAAHPKQVLAVAVFFFMLAAGFGLILSLRTSIWLIAVGALSILAAWGYTGGSKPYGYRALGEVSVFLFFGLVAVVGTYFVQSNHVTLFSVIAAVPIGAQSCAILVMNNLRDRAKDSVVGKRTLAVMLGESRTRVLYVILILGSNLIGISAAFTYRWTAATTILLPFSLYLSISVLKGAGGRDLITLLQRTAVFHLLFALLFGAGIAWSA